MAQDFTPGQRLSYDGVLCTVRYVGPVAGTAGTWLGVEWDEASRGKHDGTHKAVRYFSCKSRSATAASFVRPGRPSDGGRSFVEAVREKYMSGAAAATDGREVVVISGKVAEEVGFEKVSARLARLGELRIAILDGMRVDRADAGAAVGETCPRIAELDLSRNLFGDFAGVADVCAQLPELRSLRVKCAAALPRPYIA